MSGNFNLPKVADLICKFKLSTVVLQFPDEFLPISIDVYSSLLKLVDETVTLYIAADSTYGSSVDDISGMHVDCDVVIYFGSDLSSSGSVPVLVVPMMKSLDEYDSIEKLTKFSLESRSGEVPKDTILLYEPTYHLAVSELAVNLQNIMFGKMNFIVGKLPLCADLENWSPIRSLVKHVSEKNDVSNEVYSLEKGSSNSILETTTVESNCDNSVQALEFERVGGLHIPIQNLKDFRGNVVYIGENSNQLNSIILRMSERTFFSYNPLTRETLTLIGSETREFRERYGGIHKVESAKVIGIIIGSMGLTAELIKDLIFRLTSLIHAANKQSFVVVMGRINEAKLGNFPEIDMFCLIANDEVAVIKPKTFHVPVITPWELEIGLGARDWDSTYRIDLSSFIDIDPETLKKDIMKVKEKYPSESSEDEYEEKGTTGTKGAVPPSSSALINISNSSSNSQISNISSNIIAERFLSRDYRGLVPSVSKATDSEIHMGLFGTSVGYSSFEDDAKI